MKRRIKYDLKPKKIEKYFHKIPREIRMGREGGRGGSFEGSFCRVVGAIEARVGRGKEQKWPLTPVIKKFTAGI